MTLKVAICFIVKMFSDSIFGVCHVFVEDEERAGIKRAIILFEAMSALPVYGVFRVAGFKYPLLWTLLGYFPIWHAGYMAITESISEKEGT